LVITAAKEISKMETEAQRRTGPEDAPEPGMQLYRRRKKKEAGNTDLQPEVRDAAVWEKATINDRGTSLQGDRRAENRTQEAKDSMMNGSCEAGRPDVTAFGRKRKKINYYESSNSDLELSDAELLENGHAQEKGIKKGKSKSILSDRMVNISGQDLEASLHLIPPPRAMSTPTTLESRLSSKKAPLLLIPPAHALRPEKAEEMTRSTEILERKNASYCRSLAAPSNNHKEISQRKDPMVKDESAPNEKARKGKTETSGTSLEQETSEYSDNGSSSEEDYTPSTDESEEKANPSCKIKRLGKTAPKGTGKSPLETWLPAKGNTPIGGGDDSGKVRRM
jgi:hypothetical protein